MGRSSHCRRRAIVPDARETHQPPGMCRVRPVSRTRRGLGASQDFSRSRSSPLSTGTGHFLCHIKPHDARQRRELADVRFRSVAVVSGTGRRPAAQELVDNTGDASRRQNRGVACRVLRRRAGRIDRSLLRRNPDLRTQIEQGPTSRGRPCLQLAHQTEQEAFALW